MNIKNWKPKFIENSKIPVWLSKIAPIEINAINIVFFVFARETVTEKVRRHETIHYQQWLELFVIGFAILYPLYWLKNKLSGQTGSQAYFNIPFEREAYSNELDEHYLKDRKRYSWLKYRD